ncbi:MAG TPA: TetR/AcrR family transcriptional regulator [Propionibacteriaceae bacterium]|nr:TetR/AcrR family transcriptional regulator [Propionibacteriaceae bacterium]
MAAPPGRSRRRPGDGPTFTEAARREQITNLAIGLIAEHGYAGTSLARIAEAAGLSNAAVLYHFGSKNAVLESAYAKVVGDLAESIWAAMSGAPSAKDSIDAYVRALVAFMLSHPTYLRLMIEVLTTGELGQPGRPPEPDSTTPPRWAPLADAMARAQADGDLRSFDTRTYAIALGGALDGIFAESLSDPGYDLNPAVDDLLDLFHRATAP